MQLRHATFDDSSPVITEAQPLAKKRGRPRGSKGRTLIGKGNTFTTADFAFLRTNLLGMDIRLAASRYLMHLDITTTREATAYSEALIERLAALTDPSAALSHDAAQVIAENVRTVLAWRADVQAYREAQSSPTKEPEHNPAKDAAASLPTLEEFMQSSGMDGFSEAEVLEAYQEAYAEELVQPPHAAPEAPDSPSPVVHNPFDHKRLGAVSDALGHIQGFVSVSPQGTDATTAWLAPVLADKFRAMGVLSLADLSNWINISGVRGWYTQVRGVGRAKAVRLLQWLVDNSHTIGVPLSEQTRAILDADGPAANFGQAVTASPTTELCEWQTQVFGIVPIEYLDWPVRLRGHDGQFRSLDSNTLGAHDDMDAVARWLSRYKESPNTFDSYSRSIEFLVLWAVVERGKCLSSLDQTDLISFKAFLLDPPAHWVQKARVTKASKHWRPLRGKLAESSVKHVMRAVSAMYKALREANYMKANPAQGMLNSKRTEVTMDTTRSLSNQDIEVLAATLADMAESPRKRRYRALMLLLQSTGLRRSELASLLWENLQRARQANNESDTWVVKFIGKGKKERTVPITQQTYQALLAHREDRKELTGTRKLSYLAGLKDEAWPLIGILDETPAQERIGKGGEFIYSTNRAANTTGLLSIHRLHSIVKSFFRACSVKATELGRDSTTFERASMHWMRHTFAHQVLAANEKDLAVLQQLLGHSSISVTGIYVKADMSQRIDAVNKVSIKY